MHRPIPALLLLALLASCGAAGAPVPPTKTGSAGITFSGTATAGIAKNGTANGGEPGN